MKISVSIRQLRVPAKSAAGAAVIQRQIAAALTAKPALKSRGPEIAAAIAAAISRKGGAR